MNKHDTMPGAQYYDGKKLNIPISYKMGVDLIERWVMQSISSIMSSIASERLILFQLSLLYHLQLSVELLHVSIQFKKDSKFRSTHLNEFHRNKLFKCSNRAANLNEHAKCVVNAMDARTKQTNTSNLIARRFHKLKELTKSHGMKNIFVSLLKPREEHEDSQTVRKSKVTKREIKRKINYSLLTENDRLTPFGIIGKYFSRTVSRLKNKNVHQSWTNVMSDIENMQRKFQKIHSFKELLESRFGRLGKLAKDVYMERLKSKEEKKSTDGTFQNNVDVANELINAENTEAKRLFHRAMQLAMIISGRNGTEIQNKTFKIASPRLFSVVPDDANNTLSIFSPSLFSLHEHGKASEALFSLPNITRTLKNNDYEEWMNVALEMSGVSDVIKLIEEKGTDRIFLNLEKMPRGIDNQPLYFTKENLTDISGEQAKKKVELFESISQQLTRKQVHFLSTQKFCERSYVFLRHNYEIMDRIVQCFHRGEITHFGCELYLLFQLNDFKRKGYSVLNNEQLQFVYGQNSPFNDTNSLNRFSKLSEADIYRQLDSDIRYYANKSPHIKRHKRQLEQLPAFVLSPIVFSVAINQIFSSTILSPVLLSVAVFSPSILGPIILSPWLFNPSILSPHIIAPTILSPFALSPYVLSPIVMRPVILAPQVLNPYILAPNVLSPYILSPTVLSPLIICPYALSPNIYQPTALRALVLSPFVLSPSVYSPSYLVLTLLSPNAFSPRINSNGSGNAVILSPSAFS
ncbi:unnamed protein product [Anisakis simplex]|uniref:ANK_REP_REGION domain-containing protein n=1 Tax=Anisakis simplex TaxID=6269 RepID=A0A0M3JRT5_ANISI|nr:unnamed protein product [Anisakis simplex]